MVGLLAAVDASEVGNPDGGVSALVLLFALNWRLRLGIVPVNGNTGVDVTGP